MARTFIRRKIVSMKAVFFLFICICTMIVLESYLHDIQHFSSQLKAKDRKDMINRWHAASVNDFLLHRATWSDSKLSEILFKQEQIPKPNPNANRTFVVLVWKYWDWLKKRHVFNFGKPGSDADVPVPYGRTLALEKPLNLEYKSLEDLIGIIPNWERKNRHRIAAVLMSNCGVEARNEFLKELRKHIEVDVYGSCSDKEELKTGCPGHFTADCDPVAEYLFYLVLENTSCFQYLTEKVFYHVYAKGAVPVIFGPTIEDVESLLPPNSYLHVEEETDIESLARDIKRIAESTAILLSLHMWRNHFKIVNEHGYFGTKSYHLCRLCEALNYNDDKEKIYDEELLKFFLDPSRNCE